MSDEIKEKRKYEQLQLPLLIPFYSDDDIENTLYQAMIKTDWTINFIRDQLKKLIGREGEYVR